MSENFQQRPVFYVVIPAYLLDAAGSDLSKRAFTKFFYSLTPKHKKIVQLVIVNRRPDGLTSEPRAEFTGYQVNYVDHFEGFYNATEGNALLLYPSTLVNDRVRLDLLGFKLPILTYDIWETAWSFDTAGCIFLPSDLKEQTVNIFGNTLHNLYFDQGAFMLLKNKALKHKRATVVG